MRNFIIFTSLIAVASAGISEVTKTNAELFKYSPNDVYTLPQDVDDDKPPTIFNGEIMKAKTELLENLNSGKQFKLQLKTQNGIEVQQVGKLKDSKTFVVSGQYSFTGADGKRYKTRYTADELGYHPMTELDLNIPELTHEVQPAKQNSFQFLAQNLENKDLFSRPSPSDINKNLQAPFQHFGAGVEDVNSAGPLRGDGQSGDDYSFGAGPGGLAVPQLPVLPTRPTFAAIPAISSYADRRQSGYDYVAPTQNFLEAAYVKPVNSRLPVVQAIPPLRPRPVVPVLPVVPSLPARPVLPAHPTIPARPVFPESPGVVEYADHSQSGYDYIAPTQQLFQSFADTLGNTNQYDVPYYN